MEEKASVIKDKEVTVEITREEYPWAPEEELGRYVICRWNWKEKQDAVNASIEMIDPKRGIGEMDVTLYWTNVMKTCIREKPEGLELEVERLYKIDPDVGDALRKACQGVCGLTTPEKTGFLGPIEQEEDTPG